MNDGIHFFLKQSAEILQTFFRILGKEEGIQAEFNRFFNIGAAVIHKQACIF